MNNDNTPILFAEVLFDCLTDGEEVLGSAPFNVAWHLNAFGDAPVL
jgi:fructokinase